MKTAFLGKKKNGFDNEIAIKNKAPIFVCILALFVFFSYTGPLGAHEIDIPSREGTRDNHGTDSVTADQVSVANEAQMKSLMLHIRDHWEQLIDYNSGIAPLLRLMQEDGGDWWNDTIYMLRMDGEGVLQLNTRYPIAQSGNLDNFKDDNEKPVMEMLINGVKANEEGVACETYVLDGQDRVACAVFFDLLLGTLTQGIPQILVGGLHHKISDVSFSNLKCPHYVPETSAVDVVDRETLEKFMDEFTEFYINLRDRIGLLSIINKLSCFRVLPWKNDSIYLFAMTDESQLVVLNGNTPSLENKSLEIADANGCDVGDEIINIIDGRDPQCEDLGLLPEDTEESEGFFIQYLWDDPADDIPATREEGKAPGEVPKLSYVRVIEGGSGGRLIWGSGIYYPEEDEGGCAIAGSRDTSRSTVFNLFLIVSVLFSVALSRNLKAKQTMKTLTAKVGRRSRVAAFFVCALALFVFFSGARSASAHDDHSYGVTAGEVTAGDMGKMLEFVLHAKAHWENIDNPNDNIAFEQELTVEGGDWNNGTIYLMVIDEEGSVFTHADDPEAQNLTLAHYSGEAGIFGRQTELDEEIRDLVAAAEDGGCVEYVLEGEDEDRVACAVKFTHPVWQSDLILLAGYHHVHDIHDEDGEEEVGFDQIQCPYFVSDIIDQEPYFKQGIGANKVVDSDTLKEFVGEFVKHFGDQIESGQNPAQLAKIRNCWRTLPWKHGAVYVFIMTENNLVFFNGNGPHLENRSFDIRDDNECDVGNEVIRIIRGEARQCKDLGLLPEESGGFVQYLWDDPTDEKDPVIQEGRAPGDVPKLSYVVSFSDDKFLGGEKLIIGSGFHPEVSDSDDGCAIAEAGSEAKGTLLNLLLIVSALFSVALWKNRSRGKRA